jgi:DNA-binding transcriptional ArsR family regulator
MVFRTRARSEVVVPPPNFFCIVFLKLPHAALHGAIFIRKHSQQEEGEAMREQPQIIWDKGTAYDLFVSLWVIHRPDQFGLRPSWAAGVRSRLPSTLRDILEQSQRFINVPMHWVYSLPKPKDASSALNALRSIPPEERLPALVNEDEADLQFLLSLEGKMRLTTNIEAQIKAYRGPKRATKSVTRAIFDAWSNKSDFGEKLLSALEVYNENFFSEEEGRIIPAQNSALEQTKALAEEQSLLSTLEQLSAGVRMDWASSLSKLILAPSFWGAPFVFFDTLEDKTGILLFGARPKSVPLVPGELVPEELLNALKALADPTRLRILHHLIETPATPSQLAKILRLRPPTVIHHLNNLRLAGLVKVTVSPEKDRRYAIRMAGVETTIGHLQEFLSGD